MNFHRPPRTARRTRPPVPAGRDMRAGAVLGVCTGATVATLSGIAAAVPWGAALGGVFGGLLGLLRWIGRNELPETPIPTPPPGERRQRRSHPVPRHKARRRTRRMATKARRLSRPYLPRRPPAASPDGAAGAPCGSR